MSDIYDVSRPRCLTPQQFDDLHDHLAVVQTLASVLHIAVINEQLQPTLDELHTYTLHLWDCAAACTKRLEALLDTAT